MEGNHPGQAPHSPTLAADRRYLSVVLDVPATVADAVRQWRDRLGLADLATPHLAAPPHITVFMTEQADGEQEEPLRRVPALRGACEQFGPARIELAGTGSFRPVSPVSYLGVAEGTDWLRSLHRACAQVTPDVSPFEYRPHLTLAHHLPDPVLDEAEEHFGRYRAEFLADRLSIFSGNLAGWERLATVRLAGGHRA